MRMTLPGILLGGLMGLVVTALVAYAWPAGKFRLLRPLVAAGLGAAVALLVMQFI